LRVHLEKTLITRHRRLAASPVRSGAGGTPAPHRRAFVESALRQAGYLHHM